jgi:hypothetical protein
MMAKLKGIIRIVRGGEIKLTFPGPSVTEKGNGTLWFEGNPILGITDPREKARVADLVKSGKYDEIADEYFTRMGDNQNGLWAGDDEAWSRHPLRAAQEKAVAEKAASQAKRIRIYLSSRGWGDYSPCEWVGDITRPDADILAECKHLLITEHDVDRYNLTDVEIMAKITEARDKWAAEPERRAAREAEEKADIDRKIESGYCFFCESWCHGDCGHYSNDPRVKYARDMKQAAAEADYGIND